MPMSPFDLDDVTNLVQRDGVAARLSEQEKRLLVLLAARAGNAFEKHALMQALWGRRAQWMEDAALVQLVSRLRRSLAPLGLQRAIVTVARVGYRFDLPPSPAALTAHTSMTKGIAGRGERDDREHLDGRDNREGHGCATLDGLIIGDATAPTSLASPLQHGVARDGHGEVRRHGVIVRIPQIEYRLLCALRSPANVVHDKRTLIATLWPTRPDQDDTNLMQVVSRLRRQLIPLGLHRHIVTVPRIGYRFEPCDNTPTTAQDATQATATPSCRPATPATLSTVPTSPCRRGAGPGMLHRALRSLRRLGALTRRLRWRAR
ncbi:winged helix-turn-helix domain-containing protein [Pandoraea anhela]|uniref:OmpR/PhoB-type domain-containing protein n=1 Tax=Pandoraea anhela TaxID=2508295 RepID=A0A5E4Z6V5_9BURK|nr:winged helix-turn-helix domain-containing protein [Pandoraea anhela]VVE55983.1 hypothetical protein PAN31108_05052 [Pandoraea anhela]